MAERAGPVRRADHAKNPGLKLVAANGTPIENVGRAKVVLKGKKPLGFSGPLR